MKQIPKTPAEFDYDLWTTEDGKCMVRVKATGEVTEVERKVMKTLRTEEKRIRRLFAGEASEDGEERNEAVLSLDVLPEDDVKTAAWLVDRHNVADEAVMRVMFDEFICTLTKKQRGVFIECMIKGCTLTAYAEENDVDYTTVRESRNAVRKKLKKFFKQTP